MQNRFAPPLIWARRLHVVLLALCSLIFANTSNASESRPAAVSTYHGFTIDARKLDEGQKGSLISLYEQIKIVESVGVPEKVLSFFKTVPIVVDPDLRGSPGRYEDDGTRGRVIVSADVMSTKTPIVLHELLHAYHRQVLTLDEPTIIGAYQRAKNSPAYPDRFHDAHFLENKKEFFAVTASIFLFGRIQQPPYDCSIAAKTDQSYISFLSSQFGFHMCQ